MKTRLIIKLAWVTAIACILSACVAQRELAEKDATERRQPRSWSAATRSTIASDSLQVLSRMQKSQELLLSLSIVKTDSTYFLSISEQEAQLLGISEQAYNDALEKVSRLNNPKSN